MPAQTLTIPAWHPKTNVNGSNARRHWSVIRKNHDIDRDMAWAAAKQAGWVFVPGKVRLTITLVYPKRPLPDTDNAYSKIKGCLDGLHCHGCIHQMQHIGFFRDDSAEHLELIVRAEVVPGCKQTKIELEAVE